MRSTSLPFFMSTAVGSVSMRRLEGEAPCVALVDVDEAQRHGIVAHGMPVFRQHIAAEDAAVGAVGALEDEELDGWRAGRGGHIERGPAGVLACEQQKEGSDSGSDEGTHDGKARVELDRGRA